MIGFIFFDLALKRKALNYVYIHTFDIFVCLFSLDCSKTFEFCFPIFGEPLLLLLL